jgi:hypothetical protein
MNWRLTTLLFAFAAAACGSDVPGATVGLAPTSATADQLSGDGRNGILPPPPGRHTLTGQVSADPSGAIAGASVYLWLQQGSFGYAYSWATGHRLESDDTGRYSAPSIPDSRVHVWASKPGYVQPCAVWADVRADLSLDVSLVSVATLDATNASRPTTSVGLSLSGVIFEMVSGSRQPVDGAHLSAENAADVVLAQTRSNSRGEFFLCDLPRDTSLKVGKPGYQSWFDGVDADRPTLEIELRRR